MKRECVIETLFECVFVSERERKREREKERETKSH